MSFKVIFDYTGYYENVFPSASKMDMPVNQANACQSGLQSPDLKSWLESGGEWLHDDAPLAAVVCAAFKPF